MRKIYPIAGLMLLALFYSPAGGESIWQNSQQAGVPRSFYEDGRARYVGDVITILIAENVDTKRDSNIKTAKKESIVSSITSAFFPSSGFGKHKDELPSMQRSTNNSFDGGGAVDNTDSFKGTITAQVVEVYPNGNLLIEGNKKINISEEEQLITITGVVRPQDINTNNQVASSLVADVQIKYENKGAIKDNQKRSIFTRFWDKVNLF